MPQYTIECYNPTPFKFEKRVALVKVAARLASRTYTEIARRDYAVKNPIALNESGIDSFVKDYFETVARFKIRHDYSPNERINQPKIAGLMLRALSKCSWNRFFTRNSERLNNDFMDKLYCEFAYQLMCGVLFISDGAMPEELVRDFYISLHQNNFMIDEWACWTMAGVLRAFGNEDDNTQE